MNDLELFTANNPYTKNIVRRELAASYSEFVELFYDDLDLVISHLETNPQYRVGDEEDKLTDSIVCQLRMATYTASHGSTGGGSRDITVTGRKQGWSWIGEAKIFHSLTNLHQAFLQLTTRYKSSDPTKTSAGLIAYIFRPNSSALLKTWEADIATLGLPGFKTYPCTRKPNLAFYTSHELISTGLPSAIRHVAVSLHFDPLDSSGQKSVKHKRRRNAASTSHSTQP